MRAKKRDIIRRKAAAVIAAAVIFTAGSAVYAGESEPELFYGEEEEALVGGWTVTEDAAVTEEAKEALENAAGELDGAEYEAVALLGTQVVAGTNYCILARITPVIPDPVPHYALVYVYRDLQGNAEILNTKDLILGDFGAADEEPLLEDLPIDAEARAE